MADLRRWTLRLWAAAARGALRLLLAARRSGSELLRSTGEVLLVCYTVPFALLALGARVRGLLQRLTGPGRIQDSRRT